MSAPLFVPVDLTLANKHECPGINAEDYFMAVINGHPWLGKFHRVWFGWHFACGFGASGGMQFDAPGFNRSGWEQLWRIEGLV